MVVAFFKRSIDKSVLYRDSNFRWSLVDNSELQWNFSLGPQLIVLHSTYVGTYKFFWLSFQSVSQCQNFSCQRDWLGPVESYQFSWSCDLSDPSKDESSLRRNKFNSYIAADYLDRIDNFSINGQLPNSELQRLVGCWNRNKQHQPLYLTQPFNRHYSQSGPGSSVPVHCKSEQHLWLWSFQ